MIEGWKTKKLGDVCDLLNRGISPKYLDKGGVCVLNQKCIRNHQINYEPSRRHDLSEKKVIEGRFIQLGDVLVNSTGTGTLGRVAQVREEPLEPTTVDSHVTIVRPKTSIFHLEFFGYMMVVIEDAIKEAGEGCGGQTELARSTLAEKFFVSFPEQLSEQQSIVEILDEAFEGIITAKTNIESNLKDARNIFENQLNAIFSQRYEGWQIKSLVDVCQIKPPKSEARSRLSNMDLVSFVPMEDLGIDQKNFVPKQTRPLSEVSGSYTFFAENDVLLAKITPCFENGKLGIAANLINGIGFGSSEYIVFRPGPSVYKEWLYYFLLRDTFRREGSERMTGVVGHKRVSKEFIEGQQIPIPPKKEQELIITQLDSLSKETHRLESIYQRKLIALDALKKSLLQQAFSGNLKVSP